MSARRRILLVSVGSAVRQEMTRPAARPALADVAEANLDAVYRYLAHMVGDRHLAEDLTSATFERAIRDWHRYDPARSRPSVWLVAIARGVALDHFRREGRRRAREERYAAQSPEAVEGPAAPGGLSAELRAALGRLTRAERELVALRVVLGLDAAETARVAGTSASAVGTGLHRALAKLRQEVTAS
jgi:RNA polymerase sigma-70 factor (ECF subfamily)